MIRQRSRLKSHAGLKRRTPLRATKFPKPSAERSSGTRGPSMTRLRGSAPARRRGSGAVVEATPSASPSTLAFPKPMKRVKAAPAQIKRTRMKRKLPRRLSGPGSDPGRLEWCRNQPCVGQLAIPGHFCTGPIDPSHIRNHTGAGRKEADSQTAPKCRALHEMWEQRMGVFAGWDNPKRLAWMLLRIAETEVSWWELTPEQREAWQERARERTRRRSA